jgi:hypothetical protein
MLCGLAANTDPTTARVTAKSMEYSADRLRLAAWRGRGGPPHWLP